MAESDEDLFIPFSSPTSPSAIGINPISSSAQGLPVLPILAIQSEHSSMHPSRVTQHSSVQTAHIPSSRRQELQPTSDRVTASSNAPNSLPDSSLAIASAQTMVFPENHLQDRSHDHNRHNNMSHPVQHHESSRQESKRRRPSQDPSPTNRNDNAASAPSPTPAQASSSDHNPPSQTRSFKTCPSCSKQVFDSFTECPHCAALFRDPTGKVVRCGRVGKKVCLECGFSNPVRCFTCKMCDYVFQPKPKVQRRPGKRGRKPKVRPNQNDNPQASARNTVAVATNHQTSGVNQHNGFQSHSLHSEGRPGSTHGGQRVERRINVDGYMPHDDVHARAQFGARTVDRHDGNGVPSSSGGSNMEAHHSRSHNVGTERPKVGSLQSICLYPHQAQGNHMAPHAGPRWQFSPTHTFGTWCGLCANERWCACGLINSLEPLLLRLVYVCSRNFLFSPIMDSCHVCDTLGPFAQRRLLGKSLPVAFFLLDNIYLDGLVHLELLYLLLSFLDRWLCQNYIYWVARYIHIYLQVEPAAWGVVYLFRLPALLSSLAIRRKHRCWIIHFSFVC